MGVSVTHIMRNTTTWLLFILCGLVLYDIILRLTQDNSCDRGRMLTSSDYRVALFNQEACGVHNPCEYTDEVDLRVIVMTFKRASALQIVLDSLAKLDTMGDRVAIEIWIDRSKENAVHEETLRVAKAFTWDKGTVRVHVQREHAGIYGQWIDTWRPRAGSREMALLVEDDLLISPHTWRWLKASHDYYGGRNDISGYTLQSERVNPASGKGSMQAGSENVAFLYAVMGSWGFAPHPQRWREFQDWFHKVEHDKTFHPYVPGIVMTDWYKSFEKKGTADSMWTMWFIYYCNEHGLYCLYNNLNRVTDSKDKCLAVHREEPGLHFHGKPRGDSMKYLLVAWSQSYIEFPENTVKLHYAGKPL